MIIIHENLIPYLSFQGPTQLAVQDDVSRQHGVSLRSATWLRLICVLISGCTLPPLLQQPCKHSCVRCSGFTSLGIRVQGSAAALQTITAIKAQIRLGWFVHAACTSGIKHDIVRVISTQLLQLNPSGKDRTNGV